jgi:NAD(P)-dependent dehydrogenase (short-subunit alcohol dehydrogenase family)
MNAKKLLDGKTIVVTGCASGIGLETARLCKAWGATVLGVDRTMTQAHVDELYKADLSDPQMIRALVQALPGGVHGIANVAGLPPTAPAELVLKVNLLGLKAFTLAMIPKLADGASIVNLASLAGFGWPNQVSSILESEQLDFDDVADFVRTHDAGDEGGRSYFFSKEALIGWTLKNRWTWRERGIRMNAVSPGPVDTPILGDFIKTLGARAEEDMRVMDRPGTPADIAPVVAFLLSDASGWIRGTNIPVDGGMSSHLLCGMHGL